MFRQFDPVLSLIGGGLGIALLAVVFGPLKPFATVGAGERGVVMKFGNVQNQELDEGLHFKLPIVTTVKNLTVRVQKTDVQAQAASSDLQDVNVNVAVNWHIDPVQVSEIFQQVGDLQTITDTIISPAVSEVVKAAISRRPVQAILRERIALKDEIDAALKRRLEPYSIYLDDISLVNFGFSPEFNAAIEAKQVAEQQAQQAAFKAQQAEEEAKAEINRARGQAEAQRLLRATLTSEILQQRAIEKWDGHFPTVMTGQGSLPLINIDPQTFKPQE
jgi:prohibitin 2